MSAHTEKYFVYVVKNDINQTYRLWTDNAGVADILRKRGENGVLTVIRSVTNQMALDLGETVMWVDIDSQGF